MTDPSTATGMAARCVALGSECVEILLAPAAADFAGLVEHAAHWLGIDAPTVAEVMGKIIAEIPEIERLFDTELLQPDAASAILDQARDLLDSSQSGDNRAGQQPGRDEPATRSARGGDAGSAQRDRLTEVYNRGYLDADVEARISSRDHW